MAQSLYLADALYGIQPVLDSLSEGLKACGILKLLRSFPLCFIALFVNTGDITNDDVLDAVFADDDDTTIVSDVSLKYLHNFLGSLHKEGGEVIFLLFSHYYLTLPSPQDLQPLSDM